MFGNVKPGNTDVEVIMVWLELSGSGKSELVAA